MYDESDYRALIDSQGQLNVSVKYRWLVWAHTGEKISLQFPDESEAIYNESEMLEKWDVIIKGDSGIKEYVNAANKWLNTEQHLFLDYNDEDFAFFQKRAKDFSLIRARDRKNIFSTIMYAFPFYLREKPSTSDKLLICNRILRMILGLISDQNDLASAYIGWSYTLEDNIDQAAQYYNKAKYTVTLAARNLLINHLNRYGLYLPKDDIELNELVHNLERLSETDNFNVVGYTTLAEIYYYRDNDIDKAIMVLDKGRSDMTQLKSVWCNRARYDFMKIKLESSS